jgi:histone-lysine N-methyltransferase SETMAR
VHIDNAPRHNSRITQNFFWNNLLKRPPHPPYSPDISPSDFYRFGELKNARIEREIPDEIDLLEALTEILNGISDAELQRVFRIWIECVERVIDAGGNHLIWQRFSFSLFHSGVIPL